MDEGSGVPPSDLPGLALLLVQLGFYAGREFGERLGPLGLEQRQAGMLVRLAANEGKSQQAIAELLGLVARCCNAVVRRAHALYVSEAGTAMLSRVGAAIAEHEARMSAGLTR